MDMDRREKLRSCDSVRIARLGHVAVNRRAYPIIRDLRILWQICCPNSYYILLSAGYQSFKAVKRENVPAQKSWLQYWLVLSVLSAVMVVVEPLLYYRVPLYNVIKIAAVAYLVLPMTMGYKKIYDTVLLPQLDKHEKTIDDAAVNFMKAGEQHAAALGPKANEFATKMRGMAAQKPKAK